MSIERKMTIIRRLAYLISAVLFALAIAKAADAHASSTGGASAPDTGGAIAPKTYCIAKRMPPTTSEKVLSSKVIQAFDGWYTEIHIRVTRIWKFKRVRSSKGACRRAIMPTMQGESHIEVTLTPAQPPSSG